MAGALFNRLKNFIKKEDIKASDINAEFNNILQNLVPGSLDDYSASISQMQATTDPGMTGSESLATSLAGELERIRFVIRRIVDKPNWYDSPDSTLSASASSLGFYLPFDSTEGLAGGATAAYAETIGRGAIINAVNRTSADVVEVDFDSTNKAFGNYSLTTGSGNFLAYPGKYNSKYVGSLSLHFRNQFSGDYLACNPLLGLELFLDGSGQVTWRGTSRLPASDVAKTTFTVAGDTSRASDANFRHVLAKWRFNDFEGATTDLMELDYNGEEEGTQLASQNIDINPGNGGTWFFGAKKNDPTWAHYYAANGLPDASSDAWSDVGTSGEDSAANGVLTIATTGTNQQNYTKSTNINMAAMTIETKMRIDVDAGTHSGATRAAQIHVRDTSMDRGLFFDILPQAVILQGESLGNVYLTVACDTSQYHIYRIVSEGTPSPTMTLYIDGVNVGSVTNDDTSGSAGADTLEWGDRSTTSGDNAVTNWEWFAYDNSAVPPIAANTASGNLDDIGLVNALVSDTNRDSLASSTLSTVFGSDPIRGITMPEGFGGDDSRASVTTATWNAAIPNGSYFFPSDGKSRIALLGRFSVNNTGSADIAAVAMLIDGHGVGGDTNAGFPTWFSEDGGSSAINNIAGTIGQPIRTYLPGLRSANLYLRAVNGAGTLRFEAANGMSFMIEGTREGGD